MGFDNGIKGAVIIWIIFSSLSQIFNREALNDGVSPTILVFIQMLCGATCVFPINRIRLRKGKKLATGLKNIKIIEYDGLFWVIGFLNTAGNALTMWSTILINPAITHTFRATEPVFVAFATWCLIGLKPTMRECATIFLMCLGTCLLGIDNLVNMTNESARLHRQGFLVALTASLCMAVRNCITKVYSQKYGVNLDYGHISLSSAVFSSILLLGHLYSLGIYAQHGEELFLGNENVWWASSLHVFYNLASFHVLASIDTLTHSIVKLVSRFVMILSLAFVYGTQMSLCSYVGCVFIIMGATAYGVIKSSAKGARAFPLSEMVKRRAQFIIFLSALAIVGVMYEQHLSQDRFFTKDTTPANAAPILAYYSKYSGEGNLGDVILEAEFDYFFNKTCKSLGITVCYRVPQIKNATVFVLGGGSLIRAPNLEVYENALSLNPQLPLFVFGSGWDDCSEKGSGLPLTRNLLAFKPINISKYDKAIPYLRIGQIFRPSQIFGGIRGPLTRKILENTNRNFDLPIIGDAGLLSYSIFPPRNDISLGTPSPKLLSSLHLDPDGCTSVVVLNFGRSSTNSYIETASASEMLVEDFILPTLKESGVCIVALPVRGKDVTALERIERIAIGRDLWDSSYASRYVIIKAPELYLDFSFVNELYGMATYSVNYKLHAMILSASATTPFLCFGYHLKIYDFAAQVGLANLIVDGDNLIQFKAKLDYLKTHRDKIRRHLLHVREEAQDAYDNVFMRDFASLAKLKSDAAHRAEEKNEEGGKK